MTSNIFYHRDYYLANKEKIQNYNKIYRQANKEYFKNYRKNHNEHLKKYYKKYYDKNLQRSRKKTTVKLPTFKKINAPIFLFFD